MSGRRRGRGRGRGGRYVQYLDPLRLPCPGCGTILKRNGGQWHVHQRQHAAERELELVEERQIEFDLTGEMPEGFAPGAEGSKSAEERQESLSLSPAPSLSPSLVEAAARLPRGDAQTNGDEALDDMPHHDSPPSQQPTPDYRHHILDPQLMAQPSGIAPRTQPPAPAAASRIYSALSSALRMPSPSPAPAFFPFHGVLSRSPPLRLAAQDIVAASQRFRRLCEMVTLHVHLVEPGAVTSLEGRFVIDMQSGAAIPGLKPMSPTVAARFSARDPRFDFRFSVPEPVQALDSSPHVVVVLEASEELPQPLPDSLDALTQLDECRCWAFYPGRETEELSHLFDAIDEELRLQTPSNSRSSRFGWRIARPPSNLSLSRLESGANVLLSMAASWINALLPEQASQWLAQSARSGALATANQYGLQGTADVSHTAKVARAPQEWTYSLTTLDVRDGHGHLILPELDDARGVTLHRGRGVIAAWRGDLVGTLCAAEFAARQDVHDVPPCPALIIASPAMHDSDDEDESDLEDEGFVEAGGSKRVRFDDGRHEA